MRYYGKITDPKDLITKEKGTEIAQTEIASAIDPSTGTVQAKIDSSNKLSADLVNDASATNKFVTASEKTTWDGKASKSNVYTGTLLAKGWTDKTQTLTISGLQISGYAYTVSPDPTDFKKYGEAQIYANDITVANNITFNCETVPTDDIDVVILGSEVA